MRDRVAAVAHVDVRGLRKRSEQLVDLVRARPGITVRDAGTELGVDPTSLYRIVHRLEQSGIVRKNGRSLEIAGTSG